jgi:hypothetical protein
MNIDYRGPLPWVAIADGLTWLLSFAAIFVLIYMLALYFPRDQ